MPTEIERKFLLATDSWRDSISESRRITQAYLGGVEGVNSIRVRIDEDKANLNLKSGKTTVERLEFEYPIPLDEAQEIMQHLVVGAVIDKTRHIVQHGDHTWEIDVFYGDNEGLIVAEIELGSVDEAFEKPEWLGEEVSDDPRYYNVNLVKHPYSQW